MNTTILHIDRDTIYYQLEHDKTKTLYRIDVTRDMLLAIDDMFIGGGIGAATKKQKQEVVNFSHRIQGQEVSKIDLLSVVTEIANYSIKRPKLIKQAKQEIIQDKGYSFV
jgi:hypothetical protein